MLKFLQLIDDVRTIYGLNIYGVNAIQWMMTLYPLMSRRRKEQIRMAIAKWQNPLLENRKYPTTEEILIRNAKKLGLSADILLNKIH